MYGIILGIAIYGFFIFVGARAGKRWNCHGMCVCVFFRGGPLIGFSRDFFDYVGRVLLMTLRLPCQPLGELSVFGLAILLLVFSHLVI